MTYNTSTKTANDVLIWVKRQFGDESGVQITDSDIIRWLNQAQLEIATIGKVIQGTATSDLVAGTTKYTLPTNPILDIVAIYINGNPVEGTDIQFANQYIIENDPSNTSTMDIPLYWYRWGNQITFWPKPATSYVGGISILYIGLPSAIVGAGDTLGLPDQYFEAVLNFVMWKAYELDEDYQAAQMAKANFSDRMGQQYEEDRGETLFYPTISFVVE